MHFNKNKNILIFGASGSIGTALVNTLLQDEDYNLHLFSNKQYESLENKYKDKYNTQLYKLDLYDKDKRSQELNKILAKIKNIYATVYLAGISQYSLLQDTSYKDEMRIFEINYFAYSDICKLIIPYMLKNTSSRIIGVSSIWAVKGAAMEATYAASKAAMIALNKSLAKELGRSNINVNTIVSGWVESPMNAIFNDEEKKAFADELALARLGKADEIAKLIKFLLSDDSSYITGSNIQIDGGYL